MAFRCLHLCSLWLCAGLLLSSCKQQSQFVGARGIAVQNPSGASPGEIETSRRNQGPQESRVPNQEVMPLNSAKETPDGNFELFLPCGERMEPYPLAIAAGKKAVLRGELCLDQALPPLNLTIAFAFDISTTMGQTDPYCQRRSGAIKLLERIKSSLRPVDSVRVGAIAFGTQAEVVISPRSLDAALQELQTSTAVCRNFGWTNYGAAFATLTGLLSQENGRDKQVYLISDGLPELVSTGAAHNDLAAQQSGAAGAARLRALPAGLTAIFFNPDVGLRDRAKQYLEQSIVAHPSAVRMLSDMSRLAEEIASSPLPAGSLAVSTQRLSGSLSAAGFAPVPLIFQAISPHATKPNVWTYQTLPVGLFATAGKSMDNLFQVSLAAPNGTNPRSNGIFRVSTIPDRIYK